MSLSRTVTEKEGEHGRVGIAPAACVCTSPCEPAVSLLSFTLPWLPG